MGPVQVGRGADKRKGRGRRLNHTHVGGIGIVVPGGYAQATKYYPVCVAWVGPPTHT